MTKCSLTKRCVAMTAALAATPKDGLCVQPTLTVVVGPVVYVTSDIKLVLSLCPWCGAKLPLPQAPKK